MSRQRGVTIKSEREMASMREAGRVNALALAAAVSAVRPGATTADLDAAAEETLQKHGAKSAFKGYPGAYPFPAVTTVCINEELVHGIPGPRKLKRGDIVSIDCGAIVDGFVGDSAMTVPVGEIDGEIQRLLNVTLESLYEGIEKMRAGNRSGDVSAAIQTCVESHGYQVVREYTGHGIGRRMHEDPQVPNYGTEGMGLLLRTGMTIALEPMVLTGTAQTIVESDQWTVVSLDRKLTAHFEHTVGVTDDGPIVLTALDEETLDALGLTRYNKYFAGRLAKAV
ncbi:MAG TPA: type I methionyl aminopeptidase [Anaerolineae bacterium]|nr:type I methionyl aminopeptidase [Anaerolineae bacterium]